MAEKDEDNRNFTKSDFDRLNERLEKSESKLNELGKRLNETDIHKLEDKDNKGKKDTWDIISTLSSFILGLGALIGSIWIPMSINQSSIETTKITELSKIVPKLYSDSTETSNASIVSMSAFGSTAVPVLLIILEDAVKQGRANSKASSHKDRIHDLIETIKLSISYMGEDAYEEVKRKLNDQIRFLDERNQNIIDDYIGHLIIILSNLGYDKEDLCEILSIYFEKISKFTENPSQLSNLNRIALKAFSDHGCRIKELQLSGVYFYRQDLSHLDFTNADLQNAYFIQSRLIECKFKGAKLSKANFRSTIFFPEFSEENEIIKVFQNFIDEVDNNEWQENKSIDPDIKNILKALAQKTNQDSLYALAKTIKKKYQ